MGESKSLPFMQLTLLFFLFVVLVVLRMRPVSMNSKTKIAEEEEEELEAAVSLFLSPSLSLSLAGVLCIQKPVGTESKSSIIMSWSCCWFSTLALSLSFGGNSHMWRTRIYNSQNKASV